MPIKCTHEQENQGKQLSAAAGEASAATTATTSTSIATAGPKTEINEKTWNLPLFVQGRFHERSA